MAKASMRILVHDYSGHPFQAQLSRELARRGHEVLHLHAAFFQTPKGRLARAADDPPGFAVEGLELGRPFAKYRFLERRAQVRAYGRILCERASLFAPEIILCANTPLDPLAIFQRWREGRDIPFIFWLQDIYGVAIDRLLRQRLGILGAIVGAYYRRLERRIARASDAIVTITDDFRPILDGWSVAAGRVAVIENWAPLAELPSLPRDNDWSHAQGLAGRLVLLYAGTLGLKHDPNLLAALAERFRANPEILVLVASEGPGADWLARRKAEAGLDNLRLLPFQPYAALPEMLASADVLLAILDAEAGIYSVPSKVLTYLCAGRPLLAAVPAANLAARLIARERAGLIVEPGDASGFTAAAERLVADAPLRAQLGENGLDYARRSFNIGGIAERFEAVMAKASPRGAACHGHG
jgi:glycosyltransferase involved in cell wall biosynthesis